MEFAQSRKTNLSGLDKFRPATFRASTARVHTALCHVHLRLLRSNDRSTASWTRFRVNVITELYRLQIGRTVLAYYPERRTQFVRNTCICNMSSRGYRCSSTFIPLQFTNALSRRPRISLCHVSHHTRVFTVVIIVYRRSFPIAAISSAHLKSSPDTSSPRVHTRTNTRREGIR